VLVIIISVICGIVGAVIGEPGGAIVQSIGGLINFGLLVWWISGFMRDCKKDGYLGGEEE